MEEDMQVSDEKKILFVWVLSCLRYVKSLKKIIFCKIYIRCVVPEKLQRVPYCPLGDF